jgi:hypothetical protein
VPRGSGRRRWCRIGVWVLALSALVGFVYLNEAGLPDFIKARLQTELQARGLDLQFERLRLRWYRGIVADAVTLGTTTQPDGPKAQLGEVALRFNRRALRRLRFEVEALAIRDGRLVLPLRQHGQPPAQVALEGIRTRLRFLPGDQWEVDEFEARFLGAKIYLTGTVTNATALRPWWRPPAAGAPAPLWQAQLRQLVDVRHQMHFSAPPSLRLSFRGDARAPATFTAELKCQVPGVQTPWGWLADLRLAAQLNEPPASNGWFNTALTVTVTNALTPWAHLRQARLQARWAQPATNALPAWADWELSAAKATSRLVSFRSAAVRGHSTALGLGASLWRTELALSAEELRTEWARSASNQLSGWLVHSLTNFLPKECGANVRLGRVRSRWGQIEELRLGNLVARAVEPGVRTDGNWAWWRDLARLEVAGQVLATNMVRPGLQVEQLSARFAWAAPRLLVTNCQAQLYGGSLLAPETCLEVGTREFHTRLASNFDVQRVAPLLTANARRWLAQFSWQNPPQLCAQLRLVLPAWTNRQPDWRGEVEPTVVLTGQLDCRQVAYRRIAVSSARTSFSLSNLVWHLSDLVITRPEGTAELTYTGQVMTRDYHWHGRTQLDPVAVRPLLDEPAQHALGYFVFSGPPVVEGDVWGRWYARERTGFAVQLLATNLVYRGEPCDHFSGGLQFTNSFILATNLHIRCGDEWAVIPAAGLNVTNYWLYLTNAQSCLDVQRVAGVIGPKTAQGLAPYHFDRPPAARVNGRVLTRGQMPPSDMTFELAGGPFHYWKFNVDNIRGAVHWQTNLITISNLCVTNFYSASAAKGELAGAIGITLRPGGAKVQFHAQATNADLHLLLADLAAPTNKLEGTLSGLVEVTHADTADWHSWQGAGQLQMREGLLWELPLFGIFSPLLNAIVPGLGNSRAKAAEAAFTIQDSVIHTKDLQISAPPVRLHYEGTVDFAGNVDARVEAELLREAPLVGPLVSLAFSPLSKLFEYKLTGTLANPRSEPRYIPKPIDSLLHPLRTLKGLFQGETPPP